MKWPTAILLSVLTVSLAFATVQFAGCARAQHGAYESCVAAQGTTMVYPVNAGDGKHYVVVTPC